jgi:hypothetical protein
MILAEAARTAVHQDPGVIGAEVVGVLVALYGLLFSRDKRMKKPGWKTVAVFAVIIAVSLLVHSLSGGS